MDPMFTPTTLFSRQAFKGRSFLVTGGAHGIGKATAVHLATLGGYVVAVDINERSIDRLNSQLPAKLRERITILRGDVNSQTNMTRAIKRCHAKLGRIDGLVNNAMASEHGPIRSMSAASMTRVWKTNVLSAWRNIKAVLPLMESNGGGAVVNISTIMAERIAWDAAPYTSSKAGLEGLTRALAVELAPARIRLNTIAPGPIGTSEKRELANPGVEEEVWNQYVQLTDKLRVAKQRMMHPLPDLGVPRDVAGAVCFLLSSAASFITGAVLRVDGGAICYDNMFRHDYSREIETLQAARNEFRAKYPALSRRFRHRYRGAVSQRRNNVNKTQ